MKPLESDILKQIHTDHRRTTQLLSLFEREAHAVENAQTVDYELIADLLDYFTGDMERAHHAKENLVYRHLREAYPAEAEQLLSLEGEHAELGQKLTAMKQMITAVLANQELDRADVAGCLRDFATLQSSHIMREESYFLPLADLLMTRADRIRLAEEADIMLQSCMQEAAEMTRLRDSNAAIAHSQPRQN